MISYLRNDFLYLGNLFRCLSESFQSESNGTSFYAVPLAIITYSGF